MSMAYKNQCDTCIEKTRKETKSKDLEGKFYNTYLFSIATLIEENMSIQTIFKYREMVNILKDYYRIKIKIENIKKMKDHDMSIGGHGKVKSIV